MVLESWWGFLRSSTLKIKLFELFPLPLPTFYLIKIKQLFINFADLTFTISNFLFYHGDTFWWSRPNSRPHFLLKAKDQGEFFLFRRALCYLFRPHIFIFSPNYFLPIKLKKINPPFPKNPFLKHSNSHNPLPLTPTLTPLHTPHLNSITPL